MKYVIRSEPLGDTLGILPVIEVFVKATEASIIFETDKFLEPLVERLEFIDTCVISRVPDYGKGVQFLDPINDLFHSTNAYTEGDVTTIATRYFSDIADIALETPRFSNYFNKITSDEQERGRSLLLANGWDPEKTSVLLAPKTKSDLRDWGKEHILAYRLPENFQTVWVHSDPIDVPNLKNSINLTGQTADIWKLAAVCQNMDIAVVPCSGIMHICGVMGIPTIAIFGNVIEAEHRISAYPKVYAIQSQCPIETPVKGSCWDADRKNCRDTEHYRDCMNSIDLSLIIKMISDLTMNKETYAIKSLRTTETITENLTIRRSALGDVLMLLPAIDSFSQLIGKPVIMESDAFLLPLLRRQDFIQDAYAIPSKQQEHSTHTNLLNLNGTVDEYAEDKHRSIVFMETLQSIEGKNFNWQGKIPLRNYFNKITSDEQERGRSLLLANGWDPEKTSVLLAPKTKSDLRDWGKEHILAYRLPKNFQTVWVHSAPIDVPNLKNSINLTGQTADIWELAAVCQNIDIAVVPDSGIMHICGVMGIPTIAIFGNVIEAEHRISAYPKVYAIQSQCPIETPVKGSCWDGRTKSCFDTVFFKCCMEDIVVNNILDEINRRL